MVNSIEAMIEAIRSAEAVNKGPYLTSGRFRQITGIPISVVYRYFDTWRAACEAAQVPCGSNGPENITPNYSRGKAHAIEQLRQAAERAGIKSLSKSLFDAQTPDIRAATVARMFGGWEEAIAAAGLNRHPRYFDEIPLERMGKEFLAVFREVGRIPTVNQLTRRSKYSKNSFTRKFSSFSAFKVEAINWLLANESGLSPSLSEVCGVPERSTYRAPPFIVRTRPAVRASARMNSMHSSARSAATSALPPCKLDAEGPSGCYC